MSLDFYLIQPAGPVCEHCYHSDEEKEVFSRNITHNLGTMAEEAGIYKALWHPDEIPATKAKEIVNVLEEGLRLLKEKPEHFKKFDSPNGWGLYIHFVPFVEACLEACKEHPEAVIFTST